MGAIMGQILHMWGQGIYISSMLSAQFFFELKISLKKHLLFIKKTKKECTIGNLPTWVDLKDVVLSGKSKFRRSYKLIYT